MNLLKHLVPLWDRAQDPCFVKSGRCDPAHTPRSFAPFGRSHKPLSPTAEIMNAFHWLGVQPGLPHFATTSPLWMPQAAPTSGCTKRPDATSIPTQILGIVHGNGQISTSQNNHASGCKHALARPTAVTGGLNFCAV